MLSTAVSRFGRGLWLPLALALALGLAYFSIVNSVELGIGILSLGAMAGMVGAGDTAKAAGYIIIGGLAVVAGVAAMVLLPPSAPAVGAGLAKAAAVVGGTAGIVGGGALILTGVCELKCE